MQQWEAKASSLPMGEQRHEGRLLLRLWDCFLFFFPGRKRGIVVPQYTHTEAKITTQNLTGMHACIQAHTRAAMQTHTFYSMELNLCASRDTALE